MFTMEFYKYAISQVLSMDNTTRSTIEANERGLIISSRTQLGLYGYPIQSVSNNDNVTLLYKQLNDFFNQQLKIHKAELDASANIILYCPCSENIYKFILILFRESLTDNTTYQTLRGKIAIDANAMVNSVDLAGSVPTGIQSNMMFQNDGMLAITSKVVNKTTYDGGKYNGSY